MESPVFRLKLPEPFYLYTPFLTQGEDTRRLRRLSLATDFYCLIDLPRSTDEFKFLEDWRSYTILPINHTRLTVEITAEHDIDVGRADFTLALAQCLVKAQFWSEVGLQSLDVSTSDASMGGLEAGKTYTVATTFNTQSVNINQHLSQSKSDLPLTHIQSLVFSFTLKLEESSQEDLCNETIDPSTNLLKQTLHLFDEAFRVLIMGVLAETVPVLFCPQYADSIVSRFKYMNEAAVPSVCRILQRRSRRLGANDVPNDLYSTMRLFWDKMIAELRWRLVDTLFVEHFFNPEDLLHPCIEEGSVILSSHADLDSLQTDSTRLTFSDGSLLSSTGQAHVSNTTVNDVDVGALDEFVSSSSYFLEAHSEPLDSSL